MNEIELKEILSGILPLYDHAVRAAVLRQQELAKPP